jgi:hypothetical protein
VQNMIRQMILAKGQVKNKWWIVSDSLQKQHFWQPFHLRFAKLSFVSNTLLLRNHIKILIFSGIFNFHKYFRRNGVWPFIRSRYNDLTE